MHRLAGVAHVAPRLAHIRAERGSWKCGTTLAPEAEKPATTKPGGRIGEGPDATWC